MLQNPCLVSDYSAAEEISYISGVVYFNVVSTEFRRLSLSGQSSVAYTIHAVSHLHVDVCQVVLFLCGIRMWPLCSDKSNETGSVGIITMRGVSATIVAME